MTKYKQLKEITLNDVLKMEDDVIRSACIALLLDCGFIKKEEKLYYWGQRFLYKPTMLTRNNQKFVLALVGCNKVVLIQYEGVERCGGRRTDPIRVKNADAITEEEFKLMTGHTPSKYFTLIKE